MRTPATRTKFATQLHNASDITATGPNYFAFFWAETAIRYKDVSVLKNPPTTSLIQQFSDFLIMETHSFYRAFAITKFSTAKTYFESTLRQLKVIANEHIGREPIIKTIRDQWQRKIDSQKAAKPPITRSQLLTIYQSARNPTKAMIDALPNTINQPSRFLQTWSTQMLLMYLSVLRFCEAGATQTSAVDNARLMSWGKHLQFFRVRQEFKWIKDERMLGDGVEITENVNIEEVCNTEIDGVEVVWRPGVHSKGEKGQAINHTRTVPIWDSRWKSEIPAVAKELQNLFKWQTEYGAEEGTPVFMYEHSDGDLRVIDNGLFNDTFKLVGGDKHLSAKQLRSGGKSNATYAEWEAEVNGRLNMTTLMGRWRSKIGNSDTYERTFREPFITLAERMLTGKQPRQLSVRERLAKCYFQAEIAVRQIAGCSIQ